MSQAVKVVPILAPMMTLMASVKRSKPAFVKVTTIKVVADEDWIRPVITTPVAMPETRLDLSLAIKPRIFWPASSIKASLMTFMP